MRVAPPALFASAAALAVRVLPESRGAPRSLDRNRTGYPNLFRTMASMTGRKSVYRTSVSSRYASTTRAICAFSDKTAYLVPAKLKKTSKYSSDSGFARRHRKTTNTINSIGLRYTIEKSIRGSRISMRGSTRSATF